MQLASVTHSRRIVRAREPTSKILSKLQNIAAIDLQVQLAGGTLVARCLRRSHRHKNGAVRCGCKASAVNMRVRCSVQARQLQIVCKIG